MSNTTEFEITSSPVATLYGDATLVSGVERDEANDLKVYIGARYNWVHVVLPAGEMADSIERAWHGTSRHLFMRPVPPSEMLFCDKPEEANR